MDDRNLIEIINHRRPIGRTTFRGWSALAVLSACTLFWLSVILLITHAVRVFH